MRVVWTVCGVLWLLYSLIALSVNLSIHTIPGKSLNGKVVAYVFIAFGVIAGVLFIFSAFRLKKRKLYKLIESSLKELLLIGNFKTNLLTLSMKTKVNIYDVSKFIEKMSAAFHGNLRIDSKGIITYVSKSNKNIKSKR